LESLQRLLDGEPVELRAELLAQLDLERVFGEQLLLDHQRQVADPALNPQGILVGHHREIDHHCHRWRVYAIFLHEALAQLPKYCHDLRS
jgi:hypothetical protein